MSRRVLVLNEEVESALSLVCDAALKWSGLQLATSVIEIAGAIREETEEEDDEWLRKLEFDL